MSTRAQLLSRSHAYNDAVQLDGHLLHETFSVCGAGQDRVYIQYVYGRVVQFVFWEQGFESSRTLKLFKGFDVQFWETGPWAPPPTFESPQLVVYIY